MREAMIQETEKEDFRQVIVEKRLDFSDFELNEHEDPIRGAGLHPITGYVTIHKRSTAITHRYEAGHSSAWVVQFADDLSNGLFG